MIPPKIKTKLKYTIMITISKYLYFFAVMIKFAKSIKSINVDFDNKENQICGYIYFYDNVDLQEIETYLQSINFTGVFDYYEINIKDFSLEIE